jgi:hypothetical protein
MLVGRRRSLPCGATVADEGETLGCVEQHPDRLERLLSVAALVDVRSAGSLDHRNRARRRCVVETILDPMTLVVSPS